MDNRTLHRTRLERDAVALLGPGRAADIAASLAERAGHLALVTDASLSHADEPVFTDAPEGGPADHDR
jgi:hypothetical protein